jgi:hypothetical protein
MSSRRFVELVVRAHRFVLPARSPARRGAAKGSARRQMGAGTQFSFRLAFIIDLAYVSMGAVGASAVTRAVMRDASSPATRCEADSLRASREVTAFSSPSISSPSK